MSYLKFLEKKNYLIFIFNFNIFFIYILENKLLNHVIILNTNHFNVALICKKNWMNNENLYSWFKICFIKSDVKYILFSNWFSWYSTLLYIFIIVQIYNLPPSWNRLKNFIIVWFLLFSSFRTCSMIKKKPLTDFIY